VRRRRWQQAKRKSDPDYRENQMRAQGTWAKRNRGYWQKYRADHPEYVERNRGQQRRRNEDKGRGLIAKMDVSNASLAIPSGLYRLSRIIPDPIAKIDLWVVRITVVSAVSDHATDCKERT
jgi:hypothetical protein